MRVIETLELNALEHMVRNGLQPDNPPLLDFYLSKIDCGIEAEKTLEAKRRIVKRILQTLLNTLCD